MRLRDRLAELRKERGWSLRELRDRVAAATGERLSISYLSELERAERVPSVDILARLARGYDLTLQQLLAPVEFSGTDAAQWPPHAPYPPVLARLGAEGRIPAEWLGTLAQVEFRGHRPETEDEWIALYGMLKLLLEPKARRP